MGSRENLKAGRNRAGLHPQLNENFESFCKVCKTTHPQKTFQEWKKKNSELNFLTTIEQKIRLLVQKYYPNTQEEIDEIYFNVVNAIKDGRSWEVFVRNEGIINSIRPLWNEVQTMINNEYAKKYGVEAGIFAGLGYMIHLANYDEPFNGKTRSKIHAAIKNNEVERLLVPNSQRAYGIAYTEAGIAQSIAEDFTMNKVHLINPVKKYWIGRVDDLIRDWHLGASVRYSSGNAIFFDQMFIVDGEMMRHPRDYTASAKNINNCRCYLGYVML